MFYALVIGMMVGFTLQNVLLVKYARTMDTLSLAFYRNASLVLTMFPVALFAADDGDVLSVLTHWPRLLLIGTAGGLFLTFIFRSYSFVPVGFAGTLNKALIIILASLSGWLWLGDSFTPATVALMAIITATGIGLSLLKSDLSHLDRRFSRGLLFIVLAAPCQTTVLQSLAILTRNQNPMVAAYFLECSIVLGASAVIAGRYFLQRVPLQRITLGQFGDIALRSSPTMVGTVLLALATRLGPVGVISAISTAELALVSLLSWKLYGDRLTKAQWIMMALIMVEIVAFKLVADF